MDFNRVKSHVINNDVSFFKSVPGEERQTVLSLQCPKTHDTFLHVACRQGNHVMCQYLVSENPGSVEVSNKGGKRALHEAAQFSQDQCLQVLVDAGAQVDPLKRADW